MTPYDHLGWVGATIDGKYAVEAIAGEGGFGVVYRGTHLALRAPIAIKCLKLPSRLDEHERKTFLAAFQREARLLHQLSTRTTGIVQALDLGAATSPLGVWTPYVIMEWLVGETLDARLARNAHGMHIDQAIDLLTPVADALAIAHEEGVWHCDIKPSNVFLARTRRGVSPKILDFGLAQVFTDATLSKRVRDYEPTALNAFTPHYGAPEQFDPRFGRTGPWTDVYALALLLIEAASGAPALVGRHFDEFYAASCDETNRPSLLARQPDTPEHVEKLLQQALALHPANRLRTADDLWTGLRKTRGASTTDTSLLHGSSADPERPVEDAVNDSAHERVVNPPSVPSVPTGENRICTIVSVNLAETAVLLSRLDQGEVNDVLARCLAVVTEQVEAMRGDVVKHGTDKAVGVFGALLASDGNAERAVHAASRILVALAKLTLPSFAHGIKPAVRIGISTGRLFMEGTPGTTSAGLLVSGEAVVAADCCQDAAQLGTIVIDRNTCRQLAGRFQVEALPHVDVAGKAEQVFRVIGPAASRNVLSSHLFGGLETKLVGRAAEMQRLDDLLETVIDERRASLVTVVGAPGFGRSRLLAEIVSGLTTDPRRIILVTAQGSALTAETSYGLTIAAIRTRFGISDGDPPNKVLRRLRSGTRWLRARLRRTEGSGVFSEEILDSLNSVLREDLEDAWVQIASLLGAHRETAKISHAMSIDDRGVQAKHRITAAISRLVQFAARLCPVIVLVDDLQWADAATLDLLDELVMRVEDLPLFVVCSTRTELYDRRPHWGEGKATHQRIDIGPLTRRHIEEMIRDRLRRVREMPPEFVRTLAERAEGNPLILDEIMHLLLDMGVIDVRGDVWSVYEKRLGALTLPTTIQGIVQARLDRLDARARTTFGKAAVIGRTFWEGAVERLGAIGDPRVSPASAGQDLAGLRERQFVKARESSTFHGEREWIFAESATQEVAYDMIPAHLRQPMHLWVASWLKERAGGGAIAGLVALHADRGGDASTAASEYARAAAHASLHGQNAEALRLLLRAREIHDETAGSHADGREPGKPHDEARIVPWSERVRLRIELGDVMRRMGQLDDAEVVYEEARSRILRVERRSDGMDDPLEKSRWEARIEFRLAITHKERGVNARAEEHVTNAIGYARNAGTIDEVPEMYALLALLHRRARRLADSRKAVLRGLRVCQAIPGYDDRRRDGAARLLLALAPILYTGKRFVAAERTYRQVSRIANESGNLDVLGRALNGVAATLLAQGATARARATFVQALQVKERAGDLFQLAVAYSNLAETENKLREYSAALEHARRGIRIAEQIRARSDLAEMYRNVAEASLALGQFEGALHAALLALSIAEESGRIYLDDAALCLARVCVHVGEASAWGSSLHTRAVDAAKSLDVTLDRSFTEGALRGCAQTCRSMIGTLLAKVTARDSA